MTSASWGEWGPVFLVTEEAVQAFASLTNNTQWIHVDEGRCVKESPYGAPIAHGLLLVSLIPGLLPRDAGAYESCAVRVIRGIEKLRLPSAVYPGEAVHARTRFLGKRAAPSGRGVIVRRHVEVWRCGGEKPAVSCELLIQYF